MEDRIRQTTPEEAAALAGFMLRMMRPAFPSSSAETQFLAGRMPNLPVEIPLPDDGKIIGSLISGDVTTIIFDTAMASRRVREFYNECLPPTGWRGLERGPWDWGGFSSPRPLLPPDCFVHNEHNLILQVTPNPRDETRKEGPSDVRLTLNRKTNRLFHRMSSHQAKEGQGTPVLPYLVGPDNAAQMQRAGNWGNDHAMSSATLRAAESITEIAAHYSDQLTQSGWTGKGMEQGGSFARGTWAFRYDDRDWRGVLIILRTTDDPTEYYLHVQAQREEHVESIKSDNIGTERITITLTDSPGPEVEGDNGA